MALFIDLKVFPQSGRQQLILDKSGILKCFILSAPEDGKANREIIEFVASLLQLKKQDIEIVGGLISRKKRLVIQVDMSYQDFLSKVGLDSQVKVF